MNLATSKCNIFTLFLPNFDLKHNHIIRAAIAKYYQDAAFESCSQGTPYELAYVTGDLMSAYLHDMKIAQEFAQISREAIAADIIKGMKLDVEDTFTTVHNYMDTTDMILRKDAVSAKQVTVLLSP